MKMVYSETGIYNDIEWSLEGRDYCNTTIKFAKYDKTICEKYDLEFRDGVYYGYVSCTLDFNTEKEYIFEIIDALKLK